ncbi:MAG TPA: YCF48-related protein, partial [Ignavibacteriaceae bacterium]|nr:YCF48-related protein [Ignavibacteriaceae bacterium]
PNSTYHIRAVAENDSGTVYGPDYTFNTPELPENWTIKSLDTLINLKDVSFSDDNNGYAIANYDIFRSTDGGNSWTHNYLGDYIVKVSAINENVAVILSSYQDIWKTTNGGADWFNIDTGEEEDFNDIEFIDLTNGFIAGDNGIMLKTSNGGLNWESLTSGTAEHLFSVCFIDPNTGWAAGNNGTIIKTTDGGSTWNPQTSGTTENLYDVCFVNSDIGFATYRYDESILSTTNGGATWNSQDIYDGYYSKVSFISNSEGVMVYYYGILHTSDGGVNWDPQKIGTINTLNAVSKAGNRWIVVGDYGTILKSSFGEVGVRDKNEIPAVFSMQQNYPNPFNPGTKIIYSIPQASFVTLKIYDILGNEVATLVNEEKSLGNYEADFNAANFSAGVYFYKLQAGNFVQTKKMILLK